MRSSSSLGLALIGASLTLLALEDVFPKQLGVSKNMARFRPLHLTALVASALGVVSVIEALDGKANYSEILLPASPPGLETLGVLTPALGFSVAMLGVAIIACSLGSRFLARFAETVSLIVELLFVQAAVSIILGSVTQTGLVFSFEDLLVAGGFVTLASVGVLAVSNTGEALIQILTGPGTAGMTARRLLFVSFFAAPLVFAIESVGRSKGYFNEDLGQWLRMLGLLTLSVGMVLSTAIVVGQSEHEREIADEARTQLEQGFARMADAVPEIIWSATEVGDFEFVSERWTEVTGTPKEDARGSGWLDRVHPEDHDAVEAAWKHSLELSTPLEIEFRFKSKDSAEAEGEEPRWQLLRASATEGKRKGQRRWYGTFVDIDEQKRGRERLEVQIAARTRDILTKQSHLEAILNSAFDAVVVTDSRGLVVDWNPRAVDIFGWEHQDAIGKNATSLLYGDLPESREPMAGHSRKQTVGKRKNGESFPMEIAVSTVFGADRAPSFTAFVDDITQRKKDENTLIEAREQALKGEKAKAAFLATMSHEIRTPLGGVIGIAGLLRDTTLDPIQLDHVDTITRSAQNLMTIINDILDFSKIEAGKMQFETIDFPVEQLVSDVKKTLVHAARQKGIELNLDLDSTLPQFLKGDPTRVRQILLNLISNSVKFTPKGSVTLRVTNTTADSDMALIKFEVIDTGVGIPPDTLKRLFQPFTQADSSTSRKYGGTGLGLSICMHLAEQLGGTIAVESKENEGSNFWFVLPFGIGVAPKTGMTDAEVIALPSSGRKLNVLVADDNGVNQKIAAGMLTKLGHTFQIVSNGAEALDAVRVGQFDLVLMDCQMPEVDGYEATRLIRTAKTLPDYCAQLPIIAMTANVLEGDREICLKAGMDDYVSKPISLVSLMKTLERWSRPGARANTLASTEPSSSETPGAQNVA